MMWFDTCKFLCENEMTQQSREKIRSMIQDEYLVNFIVDNLPGATRLRYTAEPNKAAGEEGPVERAIVLANGFPLGQEKDGKYYLHNHLRFYLVNFIVDNLPGATRLRYTAEPNKEAGE